MQRQMEAGWGHKLWKVAFSEAIPPTPTQTVSPTGNQVFKYLSYRHIPIETTSPTHADSAISPALLNFLFFYFLSKILLFCFGS